MEQQYRLRKNGQFRYVYRKGKGGACRELALGYVKSPKMLVGFAVSKKIGNAVERNRSRRVIRAAYRAVAPLTGGGWDIVFVARSKTKYLKSTQLEPIILRHLEQAGVINR